MFVEIIINILMQLVYFIGIIFAIGFIIAMLNRTFYKLVNYNKTVCFATGLIGTPIHELSHALMCVVFFHKIVKIKLFQMDDGSGVLGFVQHTYNKKNIWAVLGNYFIGIAPIICGSGVILLSIRLFLPNAFFKTVDLLSDFALIQGAKPSWSNFVDMFVIMGRIVYTVASDITIGVAWWGFLLVGICIALHMNLSGADIKNALPSLPLVALLFVVVNLLLGFAFSGIYAAYLRGINIAGAFLSGLLIMAAILSVVYVLIALLIKGIVNLTRKVFGRRA